MTIEMKEKRAGDVATLLNDIDRWKSHGRGISMDILRNDGKLIIEDFREDKELGEFIRSYYRLLKDHMRQRDHSIVIHTRNGYNGV